LILINVGENPKLVVERLACESHNNMTNGERAWRRQGCAGLRSIVAQRAVDADSRHGSYRGLRWETSTDAQAAYLEECDPGDRRWLAHGREDRSDLAAGRRGHGDHLSPGRSGCAGRDQGDAVQCRRYPFVDDAGQGPGARLDGRAHSVGLCRSRDRQCLCRRRCCGGADHGRQCRTLRVSHSVGRRRGAESRKAFYSDQATGRGSRRRQVRPFHPLTMASRWISRSISIIRRSMHGPTAQPSTSRPLRS
jgi:hypothetical protein